MLTVNKLAKIKEYEELQKKRIKERLNKTIEAIDIFNGIENEDEWKQTKEEIKRKKELEMEARELSHKNKEQHPQITSTLDIFKNVKNEEEWNRKRKEIKRKKESEMKARAVNIVESINKQNEEIQHKVLSYRRHLQQIHDARLQTQVTKKVLEHRRTLQQMHDDRIARQFKN